MSDHDVRISELARIEAAVRYLEAVQDAAVRANNTAGRLFLLRIVVTVILCAMAAGVAQAATTIELFGFRLDLEPWTVLVTISLLASVMQLIDVPYYERGHQLGMRAARLYDELGYATPRKEWRTPKNPIRLPYAAAVAHDPLLRRLMTYDGASLGGQILGWLFLVVTQLVVYDALRELGHEGLWVHLFLLLPAAMAVLGAVRYVLIFVAHRRDEEELAKGSAKPPA